MFLGNIDCVQKDDLYLSKILLTAAWKAITELWCKPIHQQQGTNIIQGIFTMESLTYILRLKEPSFQKKWEKSNTFLTLGTVSLLLSIISHREFLDNVYLNI